MDEHDDRPELPADTQALLAQFLEAKQKQQSAENVTIDDLFSEDWGLSQFWYDKHTSETLADEVLELANGARIACLSAPSVFRALFEKQVDHSNHFLFEYDDRFAVFGRSFVHYDYNAPKEIPAEYHHAFDVIIADPPFLSEECLLKTSLIVRLLSKKDLTNPPKLILCTGAVQEELAYRVMRLRPVQFKPAHAGKLGNQFLCYTNYEASRLGSWEPQQTEKQ
eukprot:GILK01006266.1.p1 GENE.GILK01006266.1~~GILK01006266.1.p1  ORF type:complete len:235 (+),score=28.03 GILK01006266.1:38-706(+)